MGTDRSRPTDYRVAMVTPELIDRLTLKVLAKLIEKNKKTAFYAPDRFKEYREDPVRFGVEVLGERFTPDIIRVMESVRDNQVTIARSGNGTGKCVEWDEAIRLAHGPLVKACTLVGRAFEVLSVFDKHQSESFQHQDTSRSMA